MWSPRAAPISIQLLRMSSCGESRSPLPNQLPRRHHCHRGKLRSSSSSPTATATLRLPTDWRSDLARSKATSAIFWRSYPPPIVRRQPSSHCAAESFRRHEPAARTQGPTLGFLRNLRAVEREVNLQHVNARLSQEPERPPMHVAVNESHDDGRRQVPRFSHTRCLIQSCLRANIWVNAAAARRHEIHWHRHCRIWVFLAQGSDGRSCPVDEPLRRGAKVRAAGRGRIVPFPRCRRTAAEILRLRP